MDVRMFIRPGSSELYRSIMFPDESSRVQIIYRVSYSSTIYNGKSM